MQKIILLINLFLLVAVTSLLAQVTFTVGSPCINDPFTIDITTTNFDNITGTQFTVIWDNTHLEYASHSLHTNIESEFQQVTVFQQNGELTFAFAASPSGSTVDLEDGDAIISIVFNVIGNFTSTNVTIDEDSGATTPLLVGQEGTNGSVPVVVNQGQVSDNEDPTFTCPDDISEVVTDGSSSVTVNYPSLQQTSDNCDANPSITYNPPSGSTFQTGTTTAVTVTVTDAAGNSDDCTFDVTIDDQTPPAQTVSFDLQDVTFCPGNSISVPLLIQNYENITGTQFTINYNPSELQYNNATVHPTVQMNGTNNIQQPQTDEITFVFIATPFGSSISLNDDEALIIFNFTPLNSNFSTSTLMIDPNGSTPLLVSVTNSNAPAPTQISPGTVSQDNQDPLITCPSAATVECGGDTSPINTGMATATDNCGGMVAITFSDQENLNACNGTGTITRNWLADDGNGNSSTCSQIVTVEDSTRPLANCQDITVTLGANNQVVVSPDQIDNTSTDNCGSVSLSLDITTFDGTDIGANPVVLTVSDDCGNEATCNATVTVEPNMQSPPVILDVDDVFICPGRNIISVPILVTNFDNINGIQFTLRWELGDIAYSSTTINPTIDAGGFSQVTPFEQDGYLTFVFTTNPPSSTVTLGPGEALITLNLVILGSLGQNGMTTLFIDENGPTPTLVSRPGGTQSEPFQLMPGSIQVRDNVPPTISCPADATNVFCGDNINPSDLGMATATDDCSDSPTMTFADNNDGLMTCGTGSIIRTWTADDGTNTSTCTQAIMINPRAINASCQTTPTEVTLDDNSMASITVSDINLGSDGGCGMLSLSLDQTAFDCNHIGNNTVTLTVTDECNNSSTCTATVTVFGGSGGGQLSITCPADRTITCNDSAEPANTGTATATDDCAGGAPMVTFSDDDSGLLACGTGTKIRTWTATNGTSSETCAQTIAINYQPINENCLNISVVLDQNGMASITADNVHNSTGGCGMLSAVIDVNAFTCANTGENPVVVTITDDECGVSKTCTSTVTVLPADNVMITCPTEATVNCGESISPDVTGTATALDACNNAVVNVAFTDNPATGGTCVGTIIRTWIATDAAGNTATCDQTITVRAEMLEVMCQNISVQLNGSGTASITPEQIHMSSTGGCGTLTLSATSTDFTTADIGPNNVTLTVTDDCGTTATCVAVVTVNEPGEENAPDITCPMIAETPADTLSCNAVVNGVIVIVTSPQDEVESVTYTLTGATSGNGTGNDASGVYNVGITTVIYTVTGTNGLTSSCTVEVVVNDTQNPIVDTCPESINLDIQAGSCDTIVTWVEPMFSDNCMLDTIIQSHESGGVFSAGTTTVIYTATDDAGNMGECSFDITITEPVDPTITCGENIIVSNDLDSCSAIVSWDIPEGMDNCGGAVVTNSNNPGDSFPVGTTTVIHTVTDLSRNTATCTFDITVNDDQAPVFTNCPSDFVLTVFNEGACDTIVDWQIPAVSDNCPGSVILTTTHQPNGAFPIGTTMVEYIATDANNNADTCRFNVIVMGNSIANDFCTADITQPNAVGECQSVVIWEEPTFSSDCSSLNVAATHNPGDVFPVGTTTVEYVAVDTFGNMDTCRFDVTILDTEMPVVSNCPMDTTINVGDGSCSVDYTWEEPTFADNCGIQDTDNSDNSGDTFGIGETEVTYSVTDLNGNVAFCRFTINVIDDNGPIIDCPEPIEVRIDGTIISDPNMFITNAVSDDCNAISLEFDTPTATDDCSTATITQTDGTGLMSGSIFPVGLTMLEYTAVDTFNNETICEVNITVASFASVDPTITNSEPCETEFVKFSAPELDNATYTWVGPDGMEYDGAELSIEMVGLEDSGEWTITIVDENGCTSFGTFTIMVFPTPSVVASASSTIFCGVGDENLQLMAEDNANAGVTEWCWQTPNRGVICEQNPLISSLGADDSGLYIVTGTTEQGCLSSDTVEVSILGVNGPILPTLIATPNNICLEDAVALTGTSYAGAAVQYNWSAEPLEGSGLTDVNANVLLVTPTIVGDYTYSYWVEDGGCSTDTATVVVHVEQPAPITIEVEGETECVDGTTSITLSGTTDPIVANTSSSDCSWTFPDGSTANPGPVLVLENVTSTQSGNYTITCTTDNGCLSTNTIFLDITDQTETPDLSIIKDEICDGESFNINIDTEYEPTANYTWTAEPMEGSGLPGIATPTSLEVTPDATGTYEYSLVVTIDGCVSQAGTVSATLAETPSVDLSQMPTNLDCIEAGTSLILVESSGTGMTWSWDTPRGPMTGNNIEITDITTADAGTYTVTVTNAANCTNMGSTEIIITGALATPAIKGPDALCEGEDITGDLLCVTNPVEGATYTWVGPGGELSATGACLIINNVTGFNAGEYTVISNLDGCSSASSAAFVLDILDAPMLEDDDLPAFIGLTTVVDATINDDFNKDVPFTVNIISFTRKGDVINEGNGTFTYTPNAGEFGADNMIYEICYDDCPDNCDMATISFDIKFADDECRPTTIISPNDDGKNDEFIITCIDSDMFPNNTLVVYNQWGDQVYQAAPYANDWGGTYKGETLPDGTYFFVFMREPNDPDPIKSFITIYK